MRLRPPSRRTLLLGAAATIAAAQNFKRSPNIILLMADDQGWGDTSYNGHGILKTPHLDDMARSGVRFDRFYAGAPVCSPTRGSCLTGRHPFRYGMFFANAGRPGQPSEYALPDQEITLAEVLRRHEYRTGHFGKWHLGDFKGPKKASPSDAGFDEWFSTTRKVPTVDPPAEEYWDNGKPVEGPLRGDDSKVIMDRALHFVKGATKNSTPFFVVIWMHAPHLPVLATPEFRKMYAKYEEAQQHYWGSITAMDQQVGRLRSELRELGVARNTMLWYASDNGPEGDQLDTQWPGTAGPLRGRKVSLFEGGIRVPGLLEWPDAIPNPRVVETVCSTSDYFPTILDALGIRLPDERPIDGVSLMPVLRGKSQTRLRPLAFETTKITRGSPRLALIEDRLKLLTNLDREADMLYDIVADPAESQNLTAQRPGDLRRMRAVLEGWRESCRRSYQGADYGRPA